MCKLIFKVILSFSPSKQDENERLQIKLLFTVSTIKQVEAAGAGALFLRLFYFVLRVLFFLFLGEFFFQVLFLMVKSKDTLSLTL